MSITSSSPEYFSLVMATCKVFEGISEFIQFNLTSLVSINFTRFKREDILK